MALRYVLEVRSILSSPAIVIILTEFQSLNTAAFESKIIVVGFATAILAAAVEVAKVGIAIHEDLYLLSDCYLTTVLCIEGPACHRDIAH